MKLLKQSRIWLCALTVSAVSALSLAQEWSYTAYYPNSVSKTNYTVARGGPILAAVYGYGNAGGDALVVDPMVGIICHAHGGKNVGGPMSWSYSDQASAPSHGGTLIIYHNLGASEPGAWVTGLVGYNGW